MIQELNLQLFSLLNAPTGLHGFLLNFALFLANGLIYLVPIWLAMLWLFGAPKYRSTLLFAVVAAAVVLFINYMIGIVWFQPRPFMIGLGHTYFQHAPDSSFPSDHTTLTWTIGACFFLQPGLRPSGIILLLAALCVGWARVFLGVHFPLDILGSIVLGSLVVAALLPMRKWLDQKVLPVVEKIYRVVFSKAIEKKIFQR